jgi:hypothetical protein
MPLFKRRCIAAARVFETRNWASRKAALLDARPGGTTTGLPRYKILLSKIEYSAAAQKRGKCRLIAVLRAPPPRKAKPKIL